VTYQASISGPFVESALHSRNEVSVAVIMGRLHESALDSRCAGEAGSIRSIKSIKSIKMHHCGVETLFKNDLPYPERGQGNCVS